MKGLVFSEFLEYVEASFSSDMVDDIIDACDLPSGGVYTTVGTYHHDELVGLVTALSEQIEVPVSDLIQGFGKYLFGRLTVAFPQFAHSAKSTFDLLPSVEDYIHIEVRKLYPDAELPSFDFETPQPNQLIVLYRSNRPFADLAHGMIEGAAVHFGEDISIEREKEQDGGGNLVKFFLTKKG